MESNQNQQELNRLKKERKIDSKTFDKQSEEDKKSVEEGKESIDSLEQIIDSDTVIEVAMKNKVFSNMMEPCRLEGIDISKSLKKYFEENKIKPSELSKEIQREMGKIRRDVNKNSRNLFFNESGVIDIERSIEKAKINGVKVANYISNGENEIESEGNTEKLGEPFLINGIDVYKEIESKDDNYYIELQKDFEKRLEDLDQKYNVSELLSTSNQNDSKINKKIETQLLGIRSFFGKIPVGNSLDERRENLLKIYYLYRKLDELDLKNLEGVSEDAKKSIESYVADLRTIFKERFSRTASIDLDNVKEEDLIRSLRIIDKTKIDRIKSEFEKDFEKGIQDDTGISFEKAREETRAEVEKRDIIRKIKLLRSLSEDDYRRNNNIKGKMGDEFFIDFKEFDKMMLDGKFSSFMDEANEELEQDNVMPIYADIVKRIFQEKKFDEFKKAENIDNRATLMREYSTMLMAINVVSKEDSYFKMGHTFKKDLEHRKKAMKIIEEVFPNAITHGNVENEGVNEIVDMQKLLTDFRERYKVLPTKIIGQINHIGEFLIYAEQQTALSLKNKIKSEILNEKSEMSKKITEMLNDKDTLKEAEEKTLIQEKIVIREKRLSKLTNNALILLEKKEQNTMSKDDEMKLVETLAIILKKYNNPSSYEKSALYGIAKTELSAFLPGAYDIKGVFHPNKLEEEYKKYLIKNGIKIKQDEKPLDEAVERIDKESEKEYFGENIRRNPKALAEEINRENIKILDTTKKVKNQEKILTFIKYIKRVRDNGSNALNDEFTNEYINSIEKKVKDDIYGLLSNDESYAAKDVLDRLEDSSFDEDTCYSMIRTVRKEYADKKKIELARKYVRTEQITNQDDIKEILSMYLGTKNDTENSILDREIQYGRHKSFFALLKKISPDLVQGNTVDTKMLLDVYNKNFGTSFEDINDVYKIEEEEILKKVVEDLFIDVNSDQKFTIISRIITSEELAIKNNLQTVKIKEENKKNEETINQIDETLQDMQEVKIRDDEIGMFGAENIVIGDIPEENKSRDGKTALEPESVDKAYQTTQNQGDSLTAEEIYFSPSQTKTIDNHPIELPKENLFMKAIRSVGKFVKDRIENVKNNFSRKEKKTSDVELTNTENIFTEGADKKEQDPIEKLTGYGFQQVDLSKFSNSKKNATSEAHITAGKDDEGFIDL